MQTNISDVTDAADWTHAARAGYAARGIVFVVIGYFAFKAAYSTGRTMSSQDAVAQVFGTSSGGILLGLLVVSLFSFAVWRLIQTVYDVDHHGRSAKGIAVRLGLLASAATYGFLTVYAGTLLVGVAAASGGAGGVETYLESWSALFQPWITMAAGAILLAVGAAHIMKGVKAGFEKYMSIPAAHERWLKPLCQFGLVAKGVTFLLIASLLFTGAARYSPSDRPGLEDALNELASWPQGWLLLAIMGFGLIAFGVYSLTEARYRRITLPDV